MDHRLIDLECLARLFRSDSALLAEWIALYLVEVPPLFAAMQQHAAEGDGVRLARIAHELRPQAHYLGAPRLLELLLALEQQLQQHGTVGCVELVEELVSMGRVIEGELRDA